MGKGFVSQSAALHKPLPGSGTGSAAVMLLQLPPERRRLRQPACLPSPQAPRWLHFIFRTIWSRWAQQEVSASLKGWQREGL